MTCRIETDGTGQECVMIDREDGRTQALATNNVFVRLADGHVFTGPTDLRGLSRLSQLEVEMVHHWLRERGAEIGPDIFAGDPAIG